MDTNNKCVRVEDDTHTYIATFDYYYTNIVINLMVIHKRSAQVVQAIPQHYYNVGKLIGESMTELSK